MEDIHAEELEEAATHTTDEARMILPGVQAIMGFQLIAVFNQRFETLDAEDQAVHLAAFFLITLAMGLLMTPAAYHRLAERGSVTKGFVNLASGLIAFALLPLLIGLAMDSYILVLLVSHDAAVSLAAGMGVAGALAGMWFGLPLLSRCATRGGWGT
ncbi:MAG: DUF6328 family protein [Bradyrhizobium sp.]